MSLIPDINSLAKGILSYDRGCLSRGITLIESGLSSDRDKAQLLLNKLLGHTNSALRIAVTGSPGVGKSSLIEKLGLHLTESGNRIAVLSIDPSSPNTGGSIMGDKTRMPQLAHHEDVFIRPSPSGNTQGGVTHATRSAMLLCEAAGYNPIIIETVGTGQGDYGVRHVVDFVLLLVLPHAGDELQGIKRGILEIADLIAVTKADGDMKSKSGIAAKSYQHALGMRTNKLSIPKVLITSAHDNSGISEVWESIQSLETDALHHGHFQQRRQQQIKDAILEATRSLLLSDFNGSEYRSLNDMQQKVVNSKSTVHEAARRLLNEYLQSQK
ncbi:MAG: methylmalonyl Co-A mutase-associated GTPase MeaB [Bacteroidetes bacterium]|nr:methylmalonyl Co-A mutase-associated GTPase MeaB [Bacteroidota bacterium]MCY4232733.1 methylmalonyl Co-A mutase-associated GTPase MeaB [Bacteroidota bacterium]